MARDQLAVLPVAAFSMSVVCQAPAVLFQYLLSLLRLTMRVTVVGVASVPLPTLNLRRLRATFVPAEGAATTSCAEVVGACAVMLKAVLLAELSTGTEVATSKSPVPAALIAQPAKVARPLTAVFVSPPAQVKVPLPVNAMVTTVALSVVTVAPAESWTATIGWDASTVPADPFVG